MYSFDVSVDIFTIISYPFIVGVEQIAVPTDMVVASPQPLGSYKHTILYIFKFRLDGST